MDSTLVRGESARLSKERRASLERKPRAVKAGAGVPELLMELANLKAQTHEFFVTERGLSGDGLNPKLASDMAVVTQEKIEEVWGKCTTYKTTNAALLPERRKELVELYAKIYGKPEVTNNEFMAWVVKGNIAEQMGWTVDWASAASSTSFTLASRVEGDLIRRELTSEQLARLQLLAPHVAPRTGGSGQKGALGTPEQDLKPGVPPSGIVHVSDADLATIEEVLRVEDELLVASERKQQFLLASKKTTEEKVVVYKFGVDDRLADAEEAAENVLAAEEALVKIDLQIADVQASVQGYMDRLDEGNDGFSLGLKKLDELKCDRDVLARKLDFATFGSDEAARKAKKAQGLYEDVCLDLRMSESDMQAVCQEILEFRRHKEAVADEIEKLKVGAGVHCCPKPCLHPHEVEGFAGPFMLEPCAFCNRWYNSFDVVIASCRHFYHPFCITKLAESQNSCVTCNEVFAPSWWTSFGFRKMQPGEDAARLALEKSVCELSDTMKCSFGFRSPMWWILLCLLGSFCACCIARSSAVVPGTVVLQSEVSQSKGKHSDWGSTGSIQQVHSLLPCTSGSKFGTEELGGCRTHDEATETENDDSLQVVDSPVKQPHALPRLHQPAITELPSAVKQLDRNALRVVEATAGVVLGKPAGSNVVQEESDDELGAERGIGQEEDEDTSGKEMHGSGEGQNSITLKRAHAPAFEEQGLRKKISVSSLGKSGTDLEKAGKAPLPAKSTRHTRNSLAKQAEAEAAEKPKKSGRGRPKNK